MQEKGSGGPENAKSWQDTSLLTCELTSQALQQVTRFAAWLRGYGFRAGLSETQMAFHALRHVDAADRLEWMQALRSIYSHSHEQWVVFDDLFHRFYFGDKPRLQEQRQVDFDSGHTVHAEQSRPPEEKPKVAAMTQQPGASRDAGERYELRVNGEVLKRIHRASKRAIEDVVAPTSRRFQPGRRDGLDLRRTMRTAMRHSGQPVRLEWRRRAPGRPRIVLLLDISGSMKEYSQFYTSLAWSMLRTRARVQVFLFSTELLRVTAQLRRRGLAGIREEVLQAGGLRGGTRIGLALTRMFNRYPSLVSRQTVCIIASDGYDAGHPGQLHDAMERLRQDVQRIIWLNPLLANLGYQPAAGGMRTALPYLDAFVDVHDGESWELAVESGIFRPDYSPNSMLNSEVQ